MHTRTTSFPALFFFFFFTPGSTSLVAKTPLQSMCHIEPQVEKAMLLSLKYFSWEVQRSLQLDHRGFVIKASFHQNGAAPTVTQQYEGPLLLSLANLNGSAVPLKPNVCATKECLHVAAAFERDGLIAVCC